MTDFIPRLHDYLFKMNELRDSDDFEHAHAVADDLLVGLLMLLIEHMHDETVFSLVDQITDSYGEVGKYYS